MLFMKIKWKTFFCHFPLPPPFSTAMLYSFRKHCTYCQTHPYTCAHTRAQFVPIPWVKPWLQVWVSHVARSNWLSQASYHTNKIGVVSLKLQEVLSLDLLLFLFCFFPPLHVHIVLYTQVRRRFQPSPLRAVTAHFSLDRIHHKGQGMRCRTGALTHIQSWLKTHFRARSIHTSLFCLILESKSSNFWN